MKPPHDHESAPSSPHQYPQAIQLKLYQAFIFSIPILFSIILFLLFYLFYLKRRASSAPPLLPISAAEPTAHDSDLDLKNELKNKLCKILFDDCMKARDSLCCVCLGEFEVNEEVLQVRACKHVFHVDCIRHWLHNHSTCPLCRALVLSPSHDNSKLRLPLPLPNHQLPPSPVLQQHHISITSEGSTSAA